MITKMKPSMIALGLVSVFLLVGFSYFAGALGAFSGLSRDTANTSENIFQVASSTGDNYFTVTADGKVGVRNQAPTTALDVYGAVRAYDDATTSCTTAIEGAIVYQAFNKHFWGCDGIVWHRLDK